MSEAWSPARLDHELFDPIAQAARRFRSFGHWPRLQDLNEQLGTMAAPYVFVAARPKRRRRDDEPKYDETIVRHRLVPTRERNWHDFANALVWASFPQTKAALHARQLEERIAHGARENRSRTSDVLTCFDEGGIVVEMHGALDGLASHRDLVASGTRVTVFGHAIIEHVVQGVRRIVGACLVVPPAQDLDAELAAHFASREPLRFGRVLLED